MIQHQFRVKTIKNEKRRSASTTENNGMWTINHPELALEQGWKLRLMFMHTNRFGGVNINSVLSSGSGANDYPDVSGIVFNVKGIVV